MAWPATPIGLEVGMYIDGTWVDAVTTANGVRLQNPVTIDTGRDDWSSSIDPGKATLLLDNRDGRWSPDNPTGPYFGKFKRNIPCRIGINRGEIHMRPTGVGADLASTPDVAGGGGGGAPTAPAFVSVTQGTQNSFVTSHPVTLPTVSNGNRLLMLVNAGHESLTADPTDIAGWTLVDSGNLYTPWNAWKLYEIEVTSTAQATALSGSVVDFTTSENVKSSYQVIRTSGARSGGSGSAWSVAVHSASASSTAPDSASLTTPWGGTNEAHRWYTFAVYGSGTGVVSAYPSSYTSIADTGATPQLLIASAHRTTTAATENPGAFTLTSAQNWQAITFVYRATATTGTDGVLDISGDIDLRMEMELEEDPPEIISGVGTRTRLAHKSSGADGWEWELYWAANRLVSNFSWRDSGGVSHNCTTEETGSYIPLDFLHEHRSLRVTLDVNNGAGGHTITWYYAVNTLADTWVALGSPVVKAGTTSIKTNDAPLRVGGNPGDSGHIPLPGKIHGFELRNGIGGTIVANPAFNARTSGATGWTDSAGRVWTIGTGGRITGILWRFHGEVSSIPVRWNVIGRDITVPIEVQGIFRRLRQGPRLLESALRRATVRHPPASLVQYWPMEETADGVITAFGAAVGTAPFTVSGGVPKPASIDVFQASSPLPTLETAQIDALVDTYTLGSAWQVRWLQYPPANETGDGKHYMRVETSDMVWEIEYRDDNAGELNVHAYRGFTEVYTSGYIGFAANGQAWRMTLSVKQNGGNVDVKFVGQPQGGVAAGITDVAAVAGTPGRVNRIRFNKDGNVGDWAFGHITLQAAETNETELITELNAYSGERAGYRVRRLCGEEGIAVRIEGDPDDTEAMGPQRALSLMSLLEECAATDLGILHEPRDSISIGYRCRATMLDQPVIVDLDYSNGEVAEPPELERDDNDFANDVTIKNRTGATARSVLDDGSNLSVSEPPVGAGRYDRSFQVNAQDTRLKALANTRLALSAVDEPRVSDLALDLHGPALVASVAKTSAIFDMSLGDRIRVTSNLTQALGATNIDQIAQGTREIIGSKTHRIRVNTTPFSPWSSGGVEPPDEGHTVRFRHQLSLATSGTPQHVLRALGYVGSLDIVRADLDGILNSWVASTGGTIRTATSSGAWTTAAAAMLPGDLLRATASFTGPVDIRGNKYSIPGANLTASPAGGLAGKPMVFTCANGANINYSTLNDGEGCIDVQNVSHAWVVGMNCTGGQFGLRAMNWGGSSGFPAYRAYNNISGQGHSGLIAQGWFQLITSSFGTPPAGTGNEWGFSEWFVDEENTISDVGNESEQFGEAIYYGRGSPPGWVSYCHDYWSRGNDCTLFTADGIDCKPGNHRYRLTDNRIHGGFCVFGSPLTINYLTTDLDSKPSWMPADIEGYIEGNRVWDINISSTPTGPDGSANIGGYCGSSGQRWVNNMFWGILQTGFTGGIYLRMERGVDDTTATTDWGTAPTYFLNNFYWGTTGCVVKGGYGVGVGFPDPFPAACLAAMVERNNLADNLTGAQFQANSTDFISSVPAVGAAGSAEWSTFGPGSAFDLADTSSLIGDGVSIADLDILIDADISQRAFGATINPGAFQPFVT